MDASQSGDKDSASIISKFSKLSICIGTCQHKKKLMMSNYEHK